MFSKCHCISTHAISKSVFVAAVLTFLASDACAISPGEKQLPGRRLLRDSRDGMPQSRGSSSPDSGMIAFHGMRCSEENDSTYVGMSMHQCFERCRFMTCDALIFDTVEDKCKLYDSCSYASYDSSTALLFVPIYKLRSSSAGDDLTRITSSIYPVEADMWSVETHSTCDRPHEEQYDAVELADCLEFCQQRESCNHVSFEDDGNPKHHKCKLYGSICSKKDTRNEVTLFTPLGDDDGSSSDGEEISGSSSESLCPPPVTIICESANGAKCREFCGESSSTPWRAPMSSSTCGGVTYICRY